MKTKLHNTLNILFGIVLILLSFVFLRFSLKLISATSVTLGMIILVIAITQVIEERKIK